VPGHPSRTLGDSPSEQEGLYAAKRLALAFATIPEELPILVTVLLAVGGRRLAARGALVRRLRAAETIGSATIVLTDKTGTLTENRQRLVEIIGDRGEVLRLAVLASGDGDDAGRDPVESSLRETAERDGIAPDAGLVAVGEFPFDPDRKQMSRVWQAGPESFVVAVKGAPEAVLAACAVPAHDERVAAYVRLAAGGLRVLAFATGQAATMPADAAQAEADLELVGFAAFEDPLRPLPPPRWPPPSA